MFSSKWNISLTNILSLLQLRSHIGATSCGKPLHAPKHDSLSLRQNVCCSIAPVVSVTLFPLATLKKKNPLFFYSSGNCLAIMEVLKSVSHIIHGKAKSPSDSNKIESCIRVGFDRRVVKKKKVNHATFTELKCMVE